VWRSPELEAIFGGTLDAAGLTEAAVQRVVGEGTRESEVLDFKRALWAKAVRPRPPWSEEQEFAKDVGALANHRGGVLLVGVAEVGGVATAVAPFPIETSTEAEERRLRQALVNFLAPLATSEFTWVPAGAGEWFCAVVVPRACELHMPCLLRADPGCVTRWACETVMVAAATSEHELHPRGRCHDEAELLVEALTGRSGTQVNAVGSNTPGPVDDVADQPRFRSRGHGAQAG
jgi:hypothetical protein